MLLDFEVCKEIPDHIVLLLISKLSLLCSSLTRTALKSWIYLNLIEVSIVSSFFSDLFLTYPSLFGGSDSFLPSEEVFLIVPNPCFHCSPRTSKFHSDLLCHLFSEIVFKVFSLYSFMLYLLWVDWWEDVYHEWVSEIAERSMNIWLNFIFGYLWII